MASTNGGRQPPEKPRCAPAMRVSKLAGMKWLTDRFPQLVLSPASVCNLLPVGICNIIPTILPDI
jgi:hypothetical protein